LASRRKSWAVLHQLPWRVLICDFVTPCSLPPGAAPRWFCWRAPVLHARTTARMDAAQHLEGAPAALVQQGSVEPLEAPAVPQGTAAALAAAAQQAPAPQAARLEPAEAAARD